MKSFFYPYLFFIVFAIGLFQCSENQNPTDSDKKNWPADQIKYFSKISLSDHSRHQFLSEHLIPKDELGNVIHHYEVFFHSDGSVYKFNEYFEKVAGDYPRLYRYVYFNFDANKRLINQRIFKRVGEKELDFALVTEFFFSYHGQTEELKHQEAYNYQAKTIYQLPLLAIQSILRVNQPELDFSTLVHYIPPDVILHYREGQVIQRDVNLVDDKGVRTDYAFDYQGNPVEDEYYRDDALVSRLSYNEDGFISNEENFVAAVEWVIKGHDSHISQPNDTDGQPVTGDSHQESNADAVTESVDALDLFSDQSDVIIEEEASTEQPQDSQQKEPAEDVFGMFSDEQ